MYNVLLRILLHPLLTDSGMDLNVQSKTDVKEKVQS